MKTKKLSKQEKWEKAVREARAYINKYDHDSLWTIVRFAREIDLHHKTLGEWMRIKRLVIDKLPKRIVEKPEQYNFDHYRSTSHLVTQDSTPNEVESFFMEVTEQNQDQRKFEKYKRHLTSILYNAQRPLLMKEIKEETITEYIQICTTIANLMTTELELRKRFSNPEYEMKTRLNMKLDANT